ncbi:hypothetical protein QFC22_006668 [Naganishia vaughanmartiniae]|uniref:Uncharacterized protein n=1 Tax=Naganishia vaughanmartiniae TaxID=1424756 RepID=A0ACC2WGM8_9TREE|nr:hypothetical protein QFC22_006668 [Naganishia vaughanmartiniae]
MISLTNPFRTQQYHTPVVPSAHGSQASAINPPPAASSTATEPAKATSSSATIPTRNQSWQSSTSPHTDESKLSSLLSACEAGTHSFSRDEDADAAGVGWMRSGGTGYGIQERLRRMSSGYGSDSGFSSSSSVEGTSPGGQTASPTKASVVVQPKIVSTGWPLSRESTGHFDPSRDPRLLYL